MARTLIGELILRLTDQMSGKAKTTAASVSKSMGDIERAAKKLSSAQWGIGFQRQMDKLKVSARDLDQVRRSWTNLQDDLQRRNLSKALRGNEITAWKTATVAHFASARMASLNYVKGVEHDQRRIRAAFGTMMKPAMVAAGGYTAAYMVGIGARQAFDSASRERRASAQAKFAGLNEGERGKINTRSQELSSKYRLRQADVMDVLREASLAMPDTDTALAVSEKMMQAYKMLSVVMGPEGAIGGLRNFNKAMDNIEKISPKEYTFALENFMKSQQVVGADMDPESFAQAIKYARTSGKVFGDDFLFKWMPMLIAESGGSDVGGQLRAFFDQMVVGRSSKAAQNAQAKYGLRGEDGRIIGQDALAENPVKWIHDTLMPLLQKGGVDTTDDVEVARIVGQLTNNRLSGDLISRVLLSYDQYQRLVEERQKNAMGLDAANEVDSLDPYSSWAGFKSAFANLSAAIMPMETIVAGLNSMANGINSLRDALKDGNPLATYGLGGAAAAGAAGGAYFITKSLWSLVTAGPALMGAAEALTAAAVAQGGGAVPGGKVAGKGAGMWGFLGKLSGLAGALLLSGDSPKRNSSAPYVPDDSVLARQETERFYAGSTPRTRGRKKKPGPGTNGIPADFAGIVGDSAQAGKEIQANLSPTATPNVDASQIANALSMAKQLMAVLGGIPAMAAQAGSSAEAAIRQAHTDYGVAP